MSVDTPLLTRRSAIMAALAAAGGIASLGNTAWAAAGNQGSKMKDNAIRAAHIHDWDWLMGHWNVRHHRLKERLAGSTAWEDFNGTSVVWRTLGGMGAVDDNMLELPAGTYRAVGIRAFDLGTRQWSIWWLDERTPEIEPPVRGGFHDGVGTFVGDDTFKGRPINVRFRWTDIHGPSPRWEQAFSADGGKSWEVNWVNWFTRAG